VAKSESEFGIHWFRRDLRVAGNSALRANCERHQGRVLGLFCFDSVFLSRPDFSHNRFAFFLATLDKLREELRALGGDLLVVDAQA
jgi:deoxyribodipyrimidine photo-lyase